MRFEVEVKLAASKGVAETRKVEVDAWDEAGAIVLATIQLDNEGQDRWSLVGVTPLRAN